MEQAFGSRLGQSFRHLEQPLLGRRLVSGGHGLVHGTCHGVQARLGGPIRYASSRGLSMSLERGRMIGHSEVPPDL